MFVAQLLPPYNPKTRPSGRRSGPDGDGWGVRPRVPVVGPSSACLALVPALLLSGGRRSPA